MDHLLNLSPKTSPQNVPRIQSPKKPVVFATDRYLEPTWNQYTKLLTKSFPIKRQFHNPLWGITRWSSTMPPQTVAALDRTPPITRCKHRVLKMDPPSSSSIFWKSRKAAANFFNNSRAIRAIRMDSRECCSTVRSFLTTQFRWWTCCGVWIT